MPAAFLFDVGNVIIKFDFRKAARSIEPFCKVTAEEALERVAKLTPLLELGQLSPDEFIAKATGEVGFSGSSEFFRASFEDIFELNQPIADFIKAQKSAGARLYLLSNTNGIHVPFFESTYPVFDLFDGKAYSHEIGAMKPDPEIYRAAIASLNLIPENTIYVDDLAANCEAGRKAGFLTIEYHADDHELFLREVASHS
tara:strand:+ start:203 stop:799 length:597 start_codon:yes stop_codon:yes gene_type:complete